MIPIKEHVYTNLSPQQDLWGVSFSQLELPYGQQKTIKEMILRT